VFPCLIAIIMGSAALCSLYRYWSPLTCSSIGLRNKRTHALKVKVVKKLLVLILASVASSTSWAVYNANYSGAIVSLMAYAESGSIYIQLANQPSGTGCNSGYFVIDSTLPLERRKTMYARLLLAKASGESVNIGYDNVPGNCADGFLRIHRVG
jgi:hypothetical protein